MKGKRHTTEEKIRILRKADTSASVQTTNANDTLSNSGHLKDGP